uniref:probable receptor-like serine/threonine-protein kinase At4g34500 n=1 Tax=Erigeron canadensis TaxID=72917 RepID=UPI001CB96BE2|nr:probable receptor-like serine/threonine-protein kinase At4g34500 [Erigeron canadensis]
MAFKSLIPFKGILERCLDNIRERRPSSKEVVEHLERALHFQEQEGNFRMSLDNILRGGNFGSVYKGEFANVDGQRHYIAIVKRFDTRVGEGKEQYSNEFYALGRCKHENIITLLGFLNEMDEKILVYEHASKRSLDKYLTDASLMWTNRLKICIGLAIGLNFLHNGVDERKTVIHRDIKSSNIMLFDDWKAKIGGFGLSSIISENTKLTIDLASNTSSYVDPLYLKSGMLAIESDIYSFGVVLFEILCGKVVYEIDKHESESLLSFIKQKFEKRKQDDVVFKGIKEEIAPKSLTTYLNILYQCLDDDLKKRPSSTEVLQQLRRAFKLQVRNDESIDSSLSILSYMAQTKSAKAKSRGQRLIRTG